MPDTILKIFRINIKIAIEALNRRIKHATRFHKSFIPFIKIFIHVYLNIICICILLRYLNIKVYEFYIFEIRNPIDFNI